MNQYSFNRINQNQELRTTLMGSFQPLLLGEIEHKLCDWSGIEYEYRKGYIQYKLDGLTFGSYNLRCQYKKMKARMRKIIGSVK